MSSVRKLAILFVLALGIGYAVSPQVEGAVSLPNPVEDQDMAEPAYFSSDCMSGGLAFSACDLDF